VWTHAEVLDGLSGVLWSSEEKSVASGWSSQSQLIQGQNLTPGCENPSTSCGSEAKSRNTQLGNGQQTVVIGDGANDDGCLVVRFLGSVSNNSRNGDWRSIDARHKQSAKNDLVKGRIGSTYLIG
jgi:hypothetical protein